MESSFFEDRELYVYFGVPSEAMTFLAGVWENWLGTPIPHTVQDYITDLGVVTGERTETTPPWY